MTLNEEREQLNMGWERYLVYVLEADPDDINLDGLSHIADELSEKYEG